MGYVSVIDALTINEENRLRRKVQQLTIRSDKLDILQEQINELNEKLGLEKSTTPPLLAFLTVKPCLVCVL
jgi:cell shape-determining protein MreC